MEIQDTSLKYIKEQMVDKVISSLTELETMTDTEKELYIKNLKEEINEKELVTMVRTQSGKTDAIAYNETAYELYLDVMTVFTYLDSLSSLINKHVQLNQSVINSLKSTMGSLEDKLTEYAAVIGTVGAPYCFYESFRTSYNQETDKGYYTERYGERVPESCYAHYNQNHETVTLNYARQQNVMRYNNGVQLGEITLTKQYGAGFVKAKNPEIKLENAIDTSMSSYWAETILSNTEIKINGQGYNSPDGFKQYNRSFYDLPKGALCEICLTFESLSKVNEVSLHPFGDFPIDVIAIRYTLTDDEDDTVYDVLCPDNAANDWLTETTLDKPTVFHFPDITCKKLYILINQLHCIKKTYLISSDQMFKNQLWYQAINDANESVTMKGTDVFKPIYLDKAIMEPVWKYINNKMVTNKDLDINELILENKGKYFPVTKYQYNYGFYNIAPNYVEFQKTSVYVSKEMTIGGSIRSVKLKSTEEHFPSQEGFVVSDIEFYVTTKQNPSYNDWKSICPTNKSYVHRERLQLDYDYCYLRHKAVCKNQTITDAAGNQKVESVRPVVYMNDIVLTENADYILHFNENLNVEAVEISNIDHFALYTVDYEPIDTAKELFLIDDQDNPIPNNSYEEIMGNGTACYQLASYPYFNQNDSNNTNTQLKVIHSKDSTVITQTEKSDSPIECVTNKLNPSESFKNFTTTNKLQYYTNGNYIYFNRPISSLEKIEFNYPSFDSSIRIKAILRRNTKRDAWITPVLHSYKLEFTIL